MGIFRKLSMGRSSMSRGRTLSQGYKDMYGSSSSSHQPSTTLKVRDGEPNPFEFKIKRFQESKNKRYFLLEVNYPNCKNFHGNKILIIKCDMLTLMNLKELDPHFLEEGSNVEVMARFRPTKDGWSTGLKVLEDFT